MNEIKDLIEKTINPPGMLKKNRRALFLTIKDIAGLVRKDALTAFNAHFPYLADSKKLREHGDVLLIPRLPHDTETEYRERVAAASFYLMRGGERAYIFEQLTAHFGADHYMLWDEFLHIYIKILDPSDDDRAWAYSLLDRLVNPCVSLTAIDWFQFFEDVEIELHYLMKLRRSEHDVYPAGLRCDGRILCDQGIEILCNGSWLCNGVVTCARFTPAFGTIYDTITKVETCNGARLCDGMIDCSGEFSIHAPEDISLPLLRPDHQIDALSMTLSPILNDSAKVRLYCDGTWLCAGSNQQSFIDTATMPIGISPYYADQTDIVDGRQDVVAKREDRDSYRLLCNGEVLCNQGKEILCNGEYLCNGSVSCARFISLFGMGTDTVRIAETCRGAWLCDGAIDCSGQSVYTPGKLSLLDSNHQLDWLNAVLDLAQSDTARARLYCDGTWLCDGSNQQSFIDTATMPIGISSSYEDQTLINDGSQSVGINRQNHDNYRLLCNGEVLCNQGKEILCNGEYLCDGTVICQRFIALADVSNCADAGVSATTLAPMEDKARVNALCDGSILCNGSNQESFVDALMTLHVVKHYWCDGRREVSCTPCDGSILCDGSHTTFDNGWYCAGEEIEEEAA